MDLGIFRRSKAVFSLWVVLPLLTVLSVDLGSAGFCCWAKKRLSDNRALFRTIADLSESRDDVVGSMELVLKNDAALPGTTEEISSWLADITPYTKFTVETLSVSKSNGTVQKSRSSISRRRSKDKPAEAPHSSVPYLSVTLKGRGSYMSLIKFLRSLESEHLMVSISGLRVRAEGYEGAGGYMCDLTFKVYLVEV
jgi:hypothetical protein